MFFTSGHILSYKVYESNPRSVDRTNARANKKQNERSYVRPAFRKNACQQTLF